MNRSLWGEPERVFLWRKYSCGVPATIGPAPSETALRVWLSADDGSRKDLNRWEKLQPAFMGFVSYGIEAPHACAYDARKVFQISGESILAKTWLTGVDAAEVWEFVCGNLLGIWLGEKTPYLVHDRADLWSALR